jgi:hypothetical protein
MGIQRTVLLDMRAFIADAVLNRGVLFERFGVPAQDSVVVQTLKLKSDNGTPATVITAPANNSLTAVFSRIPLTISVTTGAGTQVYSNCRCLVLNSAIVSLSLLNSTIGTADPIDASVQLIQT